MSQTSRIKAESRRAGVQHLIDVGAMTAATMKQYDRDGSDLRSVNRQFSAMNFMTVINGSTVAVAIDLDYTTAKRIIIPASSVVTIDSVLYQEFNITNLSAATNIAASTVYITVGYERPVAREG